MVGSGLGPFLFFQGRPSLGENLLRWQSLSVAPIEGKIQRAIHSALTVSKALASQGQLSFPKVIKLVTVSQAEKYRKILLLMDTRWPPHITSLVQLISVLERQGI